MRFEPRRHFRPASLYGRFWPHASLPPQLAFLGHDLAPGVAARVLALARRHGTCPAHELVANGFWSERRYYAALARHLRIRFVADWPHIDAGVDPIRSATQGRVRLADGTWLVAPEGIELATLCQAGSAPADIVLTTPAHLLALAHRAAQPTMAWLAGDHLSDTAPNLSAKRLASRRAAVVAATAAVLGIGAGCLAPRIACDALGLVFFASMSLRLMITANGGPSSAPETAAALSEDDLPTYTVLVPMRHEAAILRQLLAALSRLDYPKAKLQVLILIEPEDRETRDALACSNLPPWVHVVFGPIGGALRTKPRALNLGLATARGALVAVFDAEDRPAPDQLRRAAARFAADATIACLQARLVMVAGERGLLDRLFAIEYSALFDVFNPGLARAGLPIPLGGTSNHFRIDALRDVGGWDPWNVTEDADLGVRLARFGYRVGCLESVTYETPPETLRVWLRQRRRWMKGWMQTTLVLLADARRTAADLRAVRTMVVALLLAGLTLGPLALPVCVLWLGIEVACFGLPTPQSSIELVEATLAASVFILGALSPLWYGFAGLKSSRRLSLWPALAWLLPYQMLIGVAAWGGLLDLVVRPFHWHKTPHRPR